MPQKKRNEQTTKTSKSKIGPKSSKKKMVVAKKSAINDEVPAVAADSLSLSSYVVQYDANNRQESIDELGDATDPIAKNTPVPKTRGRQKHNDDLTVQNKRKQTKPKQNKTKSTKSDGVLSEIADLQNNNNLIIPRLPFARLVREILQRNSNNNHDDGGKCYTRITVQALLALQESSEMYMTQFMEDAYRLTFHRNQVTLKVSDMELTRFLRGCNDPGNR